MEAALTPRTEEIPEAGVVREATVTRTKTPDSSQTNLSSPKVGGAKNSGNDSSVKSRRLAVGDEPSLGSSLTYELGREMAN